MRNRAFSMMTGLILTTGMIVAQINSTPFSRVELLDEYKAWMDTLKTTMDTMELYVYTEHCLELNGEFVDYFDMVDDVEISVGSVIDLIPGDSTNVYYWVTASPLADNSGGNVSVNLYLSKNESSATIGFTTSEGKNAQEGTLSFMNVNVDYDLVVFQLSDLKHEYRIRYTFDSYTVSDTSTNIPSDTTVNDTITNIANDSLKKGFVSPYINFYPNPLRNQAYFETSKELNYYEVFEINGRRLHIEKYPQTNVDGHYKLDLGILKTGIKVIRFKYMDNTMNVVRILVE
jgi:hypothetical protein